MKSKKLTSTAEAKPASRSTKAAQKANRKKNNRRLENKNLRRLRG